MSGSRKLPIIIRHEKMHSAKMAAAHRTNLCRRIVFTSPLLPGAPYAVLASLPDDLKTAIRTAFIEGPGNDKAAFDRLSDGKDRGFAPVIQNDYQGVIELIDFVDRLHHKRAS